MTARDTEKIKDFERDYPETAMIMQLDVTDESSIQKAVQTAKVRFGGLMCL